MDMYEQSVLCAASAYEQKYYLNPLFGKLPEQIRKELQIICVLFVEEMTITTTRSVQP